MFEDPLDENAQDELSQRLLRGQEAQMLLQNPLIEGFFASCFHANYVAFCGLPLGATLEQYQTIHHNFLSLQELRNALEQYVRQAKMDTMEVKRQENVPEDIEV